MIQLKEFIHDALVQVIQGIEDANKTLEDSSAIINPPSVAVNKEGGYRGHGHYLPNDGYAPVVHTVDFDVAVVAQEGTETKGGIGVVAGVLNLGSAGKSDHATSQTSRMNFSIPVLYPSIEK